MSKSDRRYLAVLMDSRNYLLQRYSVDVKSCLLRGFSWAYSDLSLISSRIQNCRQFCSATYHPSTELVEFCRACWVDQGSLKLLKSCLVEPSIVSFMSKSDHSIHSFHLLI